MEAQTPLARGPVPKTVRAARPCRFDSCRFRQFRMVGREVRHRHAKPASPQGCARSNRAPSARTVARTVGRVAMQRVGSAPSPQGRGGSIPPLSAIRARSPIGRRRHLEVVNSAGSNPAARTKAIVAQPAGGAALKTRTVRVRIPPMAPCWRSPTAEAANLKLAPVSVRIGPPARVPFRSAGCNPADCETERRASRGSTPRGPTTIPCENSMHDRGQDPLERCSNVVTFSSPLPLAARRSPPLPRDERP